MGTPRISADFCARPMSYLGRRWNAVSPAPLLDLVADVRASTPTDAARRIVPHADPEHSSTKYAIATEVNGMPRETVIDVPEPATLVEFHGFFELQ